MVVALIVLSLLIGTGLACASDRAPNHAATLEWCGGAFFVAGLALLGAALPIVWLK
jgi:hypothetical protein